MSSSSASVKANKMPAKKSDVCLLYTSPSPRDS